MKDNEHLCGDEDCIFGGYGEAITGCKEINGELFVGNGEYVSAVKYCPFCGISLEKKL